MDKFKISVIVPIYNVQEYLKKSLDSLIYQTYKNYEVIMVDDGSTDDSAIIARKYLFDDRFMLITQENQGLSGARNTGLKYASGNYIYFFDPDDQISTNFFKTCIRLFKENDVDLISFDKKEVKELIKVEDLPKFVIKTKKQVNKTELIELLLNCKINETAWSYITTKKIYFDSNIIFPLGKRFEDVTTTTKVFSNIKSALILDGTGGPYFYLNYRKGSIMSNVMDNGNKDQLRDIFDALNSKYLYLKAKKIVDNSLVTQWYFNKMLIMYNWYFSLFDKETRNKYLTPIRRKIIKFYDTHNVIMTNKMRLRFLKLRFPFFVLLLNWFHYKG